MALAFDATLIDKLTGAKLITWSEHPNATLRLVERAPTIGWIHDDALAGRVLAGLTVVGGKIVLGGKNPGVKLDFDVTAPMAYTVYAEHGPERWRLGTVVDDGDGGSLTTTLSFREPAAVLSAGETVRLVFEPDPNLARTSFDLTEILDRGFAIEDVPLVNGSGRREATAGDRAAARRRSDLPRGATYDSLPFRSPCESRSRGLKGRGTQSIEMPANQIEFRYSVGWVKGRRTHRAAAHPLYCDPHAEGPATSHHGGSAKP